MKIYIDFINLLNLQNKIEKFAKNQIHQGVILKCEPLPYVRISNTQQLNVGNKKEGVLWIFLDQITDPQNFGALLRTSYFLGVDGILVSEKNRCPLNATVNKVSVGALELMEINCVKEPFEFLKQSSREGWKILATGELSKGLEGKNIDYRKINLKKTDNVILIFGSEGSGISHEFGVAADKSLIIPPMMGKENITFPRTLVDSLNVSVSAGIIISFIRELLNINQ